MTVDELPDRAMVSLTGDNKLTLPSVPWNTVKTTTWGGTALYDYVHNGYDIKSNVAHNTLQPCKAVYAWYRTA